jgi:adenylate cyclase class 2
MLYEVEQKYPLADLEPVRRRLLELGAAVGEDLVQVDQYFAHPVRDFACTDEALRIRSVGNDNFVTYKGPKIDAATKTRHEIELPLAAGSAAAADFRSLLEALGFTAVAEVRKRRRTLHLRWQDQDFEAALDDVSGLGTFLELELKSEPDGLETAKAALASLAAELGLTASERRSYLELLQSR